ncbi:putative serine protease HtrA [Rubripirellula obstinata]|uniref:Putative serine protease HtrA n=1 Tax=Rubripirellula obstinata TaxID=406547 RepID=A0A5B1CDH5_9BACT|nr:S1C family serine protease [Rubripirellula obstinata]KAA1257945.1 putative serine protease HtrA [Rubripirellula obstinata]
MVHEQPRSQCIPSQCVPRHSTPSRSLRLTTFLLFVFLANTASAQTSAHDWARTAQSKVVKVYGAGGMKGLEAYQSGFLVSPEGHIATAWSYVLDVEPIVLLDDGRRFEAEIIHFEPSLEIAVLKIDASALPYFELPKIREVQWGDPVLAISNLFNIATGDEAASIMQGRVASIASLDARSGTLKTPYRGEVLVLDLVANNPGAAGGAVVSADGKLAGMLGKELRDSATGVWLNYALPADVFRKTIGDIIAGRATSSAAAKEPQLPRDRSHNLQTLGLVLVPDVLETTPAFVDRVVTGSPAEEQNLRPDDLILLVSGQRTENQRLLKKRLRSIDRRDDVTVTIQRDNDILTVVLKP